MDRLDPPKILLSQTKSLSTSDNDLQPKSPVKRGVKYSQSLRVKRDGTSKADRSGWSLGNMAKKLSTGVVQGTKAVGSGVVQGTKAVGSGVVQGSLVVGSGVVQGSKAVGTGVVQGTKVVGTGVVAAGRMTKDVTIAVGKGVYHASEDVVSAAVTGVSAAGEATVSAGRVVTSASVSAVIDTTKWVKEQSESFGGDDHEAYTVLPGDTLDDIALNHGVTVYDLIRLNTLHRRYLIPGKLLLIPDESDQILAHPDEIFVAKAFIIFQPGQGDIDEDETDGVVRLSTNKMTFKSSAGSLLMDYSPSEVRQLSLDVCETADCVPDLLPAHSIDENDYSNNSSTSSNDDCLGGDETPRQQQHCHIVEVDLTLEATKRERSNTDDVTVILEIRVMVDQEQVEDPEEKGEEGGKEDNDDDAEEDLAKMHLYRFRFTQSDLVSIHSYIDLWHSDKLKVSDNFLRHLTIESSGLEDAELDDAAGPRIMDDSSVLDDRHMREVYRSLPLKIQNQPWTLAYSTRINGFSLQNLYRTMTDQKEPSLVVIQDSNGFIFGAFLTCTPCVCENFIGTGKSWIFCFGKIELVAGPVEEEGGGEETSDESFPTVVGPHHLNVFHWSGRNEYFFRGTTDTLIIGAGDGKFGISVDGDLHKGRIQECDTFEGWPHREQDFIISCLECWRFT